MSRILKTGDNRITQTYTQHRGWAKGVDIVKAPALTDFVIAHSDGTVIKAVTGQKNGSTDSEGFGYGNYVMLSHNDGYVSLYAHLEGVSVHTGQAVSKGQTIGIMGNTGNSFGAHLHFEVRKYNTELTNGVNLHDITRFKWLNPEAYIDIDFPGNSYADFSDYENNIIPNRFKVILNGTQTGAYTEYKNALNAAKTGNGIILDGSNNRIQIYP